MQALRPLSELCNRFTGCFSSHISTHSRRAFRLSHPCAFEPMFASSQATASGRRNGKQVAQGVSAADMGRKIFVKELSFSLSADAIPWLVRLAEEYDLENELEMMDDTFRRIAGGLAGQGDGFGELYSDDASPASSGAAADAK